VLDRSSTTSTGTSVYITPAATSTGAPPAGRHRLLQKRRPEAWRACGVGEFVTARRRLLVVKATATRREGIVTLIGTHDQDDGRGSRQALKLSRRVFRLMIWTPRCPT